MHFCGVVLVLLSLVLGASTSLSAQGISTTAIRVTLRTEDGGSVEDARVRVVNDATGYANETRIRGGSFLIEELPAGGPYRVVVTGIGYSPQVMDSLWLTLGERREVEFTLVSVAHRLDTVRVSAAADRHRGSPGAVGTLISDSSLRRLPTLNRNMYDFVRIVPQVGSRFGLTGAGSGFRFNSYVIDGVTERQLQGNEVPGGAGPGGRTISIEAVKEYEVLLSPYDARFGDFTGLLVNAVTKSGTNELRGSVFGYMRNEHFARKNSFVGSSPYRNEQFGFSLGGPIVRDRAHFFIATEFQHAVAPSSGPYVGQSSSTVPHIPVSPDDVARFALLLHEKGLDAGDGGRVMLSNPVSTLSGRLDFALPELKTRVVFRDNYSTIKAMRFVRVEGGRTFPLTSNGTTLETAKHAPALQIFTHASAALSNELALAYLDRPLRFIPESETSFILATVRAQEVNGLASLTAGAPAAHGGSDATQKLVEIADHLEFRTASRHTIRTGVHIEIFRFHSEGARGKLGQWRFSSLDSLAHGDATFFQIGKDFGSGNAPVNGAQPSVYVTDDWRLSDRLSVIIGLRADALKFSSRPSYNPEIDSLFQRRTSDFPRTRVQWSPRLGFDWEPFGDDFTRVRGGAGIFVAPPPLGWLLGPARFNGSGVRTLTCSAQLGQKVPKFVADPNQQPQACADGTSFSNGPVALVDRNLKMAESFRASLGIDRRLPWNLDASVDALFSKVRSDFMFVNLNLRGPQGVDSHGRVMYGKILPNGTAEPALVASGRFPEVTDVRNHSLGSSWSITTQLRRSFSERVELNASYTHTRSRDLQSLTNSSAVAPLDIWASGRPLSGRHDDLSTGISSFQIPHRVVLAATYTAPWQRWKTDLSLYYIGESGSPFTYGDSSAAGLGDLNADGTSANDPIYVPRDTHDPSEIEFSGGNAAQADAFEQFIRDTPCLRRQRGTILARNSCTGPWVNTSNASLRQSLQAIGRRDLSLQLEVFNVLNLLNSSWGLFRVPNTVLLQQVGQTSGASPHPVFVFDAATARSSTRNAESGYQLQLSLRYSF